MKLKWSIDQLYFYLVCFVMLITIIVGVTSLVRAGIDLLIPVPETSIGRPYEQYPQPPPPNGTGETQSKLPREVIEREQSNWEELNKNSFRQNALNSTMLNLFRGLAQLFVAFPIYIYHWRKIPELDL
jgi:hypothetical protein